MSTRFKPHREYTKDEKCILEGCRRKKSNNNKKGYCYQCYVYFTRIENMIKYAENILREYAPYKLKETESKPTNG